MSRVKLASLAAGLALAFVVGGCASSATVQNAPADAGEARSFNATYEQVKQASLDALTAIKMPPRKTEEKANGLVLLVARSPHGMSWGEVGRITVEKSTTPPTTVRVVYDKRLAVQAIGAQSRFARLYFGKLEAALTQTAAQ
jgi:hypothetical protein